MMRGGTPAGAFCPAGVPPLIHGSLAMAELYETLKASLARERPVALATLVSGPGMAGAKLLVFTDGTTQGTLGAAALDARVAQDAREMIGRGENKTTTYAPEAG